MLFPLRAPGFYSKPSIAVITLHYNCLLKEPAIMDEHVAVPYFRQELGFIFVFVFVFLNVDSQA